MVYGYFNFCVKLFFHLVLFILITVMVISPFALIGGGIFVINGGLIKEGITLLLTGISLGSALLAIGATKFAMEKK